MSEAELMADRPKWLSEDEYMSIMLARDEDKRMVNFRLSAEGRRILEAEAASVGDKTKALEIILREIRELRRRKK